MTPAARLQAVIDILGQLQTTNQPADRHLREWGRMHRYAGSKDRAAVAERVFAILRHRATLAWRMRSDAPRALAMASLLKEGQTPDDLAAIFNGAQYGPEALSAAEREIVATPPAETPPPHVAGEYPRFLEAQLQLAFGDRLAEEMQALQSRAPVDLRVNTLKATREDVLDGLRGQGYAVEPTRHAPAGIRIPSGEGSAKLGRAAMFEAGDFEFQDEAAQIASVLCGARPGMRVLDLAAGAGGKSLALAALMQNQGEIVATDIRLPALVELERRAARAGASIIQTSPAPSGLFDIVLVDAPCSGTGTWRRQPELRWSLSEARLAELTRTQDMLLARAAAFVRPGGRLVYATCSVLPCENTDRVAGFVAAHPDFTVLNAADLWLETRGSAEPPGLSAFFEASPLRTATDGFFVALLERKAP